MSVRLFSCNFPELYYILICDLSGSTIFVAFSHEQHGSWNTLLNIQNVLLTFPDNYCLEYFSF